MRLVIDKSVLRALPRQRFEQLRKRHRLVMTEALFYELMTCDAEQRAMLFRKIGGAENPLGVVPNPGFVWGRELESGSPVDSAAAAELNRMTWIFNESLADPGYELPTEIAREVQEWKEHRAGEVASFLERAAATPEMFPQVRGIAPGASPDLVRALLESLGGESPLVREFYASLADANGELVPVEFGPQWVGYRILQAQLIWCVDWQWRQGPNARLAGVSAENTVCDIEYAIAAVHTDGLLSHDAGLIRLAGTMQPGLLISDGSDL